jgi:hypothetical protein
VRDGEGDVQALLRRLGVRQAAVRLLTVVAGVAERVRAHAPRSVRKKWRRTDGNSIAYIEAMI